MIVWGGLKGPGTIGSNYLNDGAKYNPTTDTWTPMTNTNAPSPRYGFSNIWTGTEFIAWGGAGPIFARLGTGGKYNPSTDTWTTISTSPLNGRFGFAEAWTGTEMIIWGGHNSTSLVMADGAKYNPSTDSWVRMSDTNRPTKRHAPVVTWTADKLFIASGFTNFQAGLLQSASIYNNANDSWESVTQTGGPNPFRASAIFWSGKRIFIWGGLDASGNYLDDGYIYAPEEVTIPKVSNGSRTFHLYEKE
jgi:N-acetylneuraminic acid mutarotase